MDEKRVSFGFVKNHKKPSLLTGPASSVSLKKNYSKQMIDCLEKQSIKIIGETEKEPAPLVIPLREQDKTTIPDRLAKVLGIKQEVHEKLKDIQQTNVKSEQSSNFVVPLLPEDLPLDGACESSMDDYESVPIAKFGLRMLRGMGWKDPDPKKVEPKYLPVMYPMGIGLETVPALKTKANNAYLIPPAQGETLAMKGGAQVKVFAGEHKDAYGTVESFDEHNKRVIVKFAIGGATESVNECLVMLVSKQEYNQYAKILNAAKYEELIIREKLQTDETEQTSSKSDRKERKDRSEDSYREDRVRPTERSLSQRHDRVWPPIG